ncbi:hypothetical protein Ocin01_14232 [Orchesella cincta]|uniref:MARVEL domain-containing protein n=1 Tax=Orchesella cincta TaxID=48709 RepID=A0A1D2MHH4_ORCCI|nr:hypothetical protein Ocin01_14232 [Orchesella cincta]
MKLNLGHVKSLAGLLKIIGLVVGLIAASLGASAFINSPYNKSCGDDGVTLPPRSNSTGSTLPGDITTTTLRTREPVTVTQPGKFQTEATTSPPGGNNSTALPPTEKTDCEMAPVLWMERFQISITWITVIVSAALLICYILSEDFEYNKIFKGVNFGFHFVGCIFLIISALFLAFAAIEIDNKICSDERFTDSKEDCQKFKQKMSAAGFTLLQAVLYAVISVRVIGKKLYEEV